MKKTLNTLAIAVAACLAAGGAARAGSMGYPEGYTATEIDTAPTYTYSDQQVIQEQPETIGERIVRFPGRTVRTAARTPVIVGESVAGRRRVVSEGGFFTSADTDRVYDADRVVYREDLQTRPYTRRLSSRRIVTTQAVPVREETVGQRIVRFPGRAVRTAVTSPVIVGETLSGRRQVVSDRGFLARTNGERVVYQNEDLRMRPARRLSSRRIIYRTEDGLRATGETVGRGIVRTGRTIVHTPRIIGETITGERRVVNEQGRPLSY